MPVDALQLEPRAVSWNAGKSFLSQCNSPRPEEWCNAKAARRDDPELCLSHYYTEESTYKDETTLLLYYCRPDGDKCVSEPIPMLCPSDSPSSPSYVDCSAVEFSDSELSDLTDLRELQPRQWCNTDPARRNDATLCAKYYVTTDQTSEYTEGFRCTHDSARGKCVAADTPFKCAP